MAKIKPYSQEVSNVRVNQLLERAYHGETEHIRNKAREELIGRNKALARRANIQLSHLERAGYDRWAYDRAISYIESQSKYLTKRFSGKEKDFDDLKDIAWNIREMSTFLRSKSATVGGNREIDREILVSFREKGVSIKKGEERAFFDLLNSDSWEELKKTYYGSQDAIDMLVQVTNRGRNTTLDWDRLNEQLSKVANDELTMDIALKEFGYTI